jgi:DNA-directed RNA polymerase specialized sigma24 family protein
MERRAVAANHANDWKGPAFRRTLIGIVRRHVPESDVEDIVQSALTEALSPTAPTDDEALQRWLIGVARHKIADRHRRSRRESFDVPELHVEAAPHSENDLVRWAERALPQDDEEPRRTLEWMIREGDGEKLESIAASEQIPAPRVRKRVSRLREHLRAAWRKEVALLAALGIVIVLVWLAHRRSHEPIAHDDVRPVPSSIAPSPIPALSAPVPIPIPTPSATPTPRATPIPSATPTATSAPSAPPRPHATKAGRFSGSSI